MLTGRQATILVLWLAFIRYGRWLIALCIPLLGAILLLAYHPGSGLEGITFVVASGVPEAESSSELASLAEEAIRQGARVDAVHTAGPAESLDAVRGQRAEFAIAPIACLPSIDGVDVVAMVPVELAFLLIGAKAGAVEHVRDLAGQRITVGPGGSATAIIASRVFGLSDLSSLPVRVESVDVPEYFRRYQDGDGLVAAVARTDSPKLRKRVSRGLEIASLSEAPALASRLPFTRAAVLPASFLDLGLGIPARDRQVIEFPLALFASPHLRRSRVVEMLRLLHAAYPDIIAFNKRRADEATVALHPSSVAFFTAGGPSFIDVHLPVAHDFLAFARIAQLAIVGSLLANVLDVLRRRRQWRLIAEYRRLGGDVARLVGVDAVEVPFSVADQIPAVAGSVPAIDRLLEKFAQLRAMAHRQNESVTAPLEGDAVARGIEALATEWEYSLRAARTRAAGGA